MRLILAAVFVFACSSVTITADEALEATARRHSSEAKAFEDEGSLVEVEEGEDAVDEVGDAYAEDDEDEAGEEAYDDEEVEDEENDADADEDDADEEEEVSTEGVCPGAKGNKGPKCCKKCSQCCFSHLTSDCETRSLRSGKTCDVFGKKKWRCPYDPNKVINC